jgi:hypothetical protein
MFVQVGQRKARTRRASQRPQGGRFTAERGEVGPIPAPRQEWINLDGDWLDPDEAAEYDAWLEQARAATAAERETEAPQESPSYTLFRLSAVTTEIELAEADRQRLVGVALAQGASMDAIAERLKVSKSTVWRRYAAFTA